MATQKYKNLQRSDVNPTDGVPESSPTVASVKQELDDDIDSVLDINSAEFVRGFVQKDGQ